MIESLSDSLAELVIVAVVGWLVGWLDKTLPPNPNPTFNTQLAITMIDVNESARANVKL